MPLGKILYESGDGLHYVYFPTTCIVSKLYVTKNGASAEIAVVGSNGIIGISIFMGAEEPCLTGPSCGVRTTPIGCERIYLCRNSIVLRDVAPRVTLFIAALYPSADYPDGTASSL